MTYEEKLNITKRYYPFAEWRLMFFPDPNDEGNEGQPKYTQESCDTARAIFDNLLIELALVGEYASPDQKLPLFEKAVKALNDLDEQAPRLIVTGEREELCDLIDQITVAAGLDPNDYADGAGIADLWREW